MNYRAKQNDLKKYMSRWLSLISILFIIDCSYQVLAADVLAADVKNPDFVEGALYVKFREENLDFPKDMRNTIYRDVEFSPLLSSGCLVFYREPSDYQEPSTTEQSIDNVLDSSVAESSSKVGRFMEVYGINEKAYSLRVRKSSDLDYIFRIEFDSITKTQALINELEENPAIEYVEKVPMYHLAGSTSFTASTSPSDPFYGEISGVNTSWHLDMVGFQELYGKYKGNGNLKVAVVDNAVWAQHEDLQIDSAYVYDAYNNIAGVAMPPSYVSPNQIGTPEEPSSAYMWSHGTHCAGLIGALTDNGVGITSLASGVNLMGVRVSDNTGNNLNSAPKGVLWAVDHGAKVISMSFGSETYSITEEKIYKELVEQGIILVAAAGNKGVDVPNYPANYDGIICVGSVNSDGKRSSFSNFGDWVDVWAPGGYLSVNGKEDVNNQIFSTTFCITQYYWKKEEFSKKKYDAMVGTSMATPLVTSAVSLLLSYYPELNIYEIQDILQTSSAKGYIYIPEAFELIENGKNLQVQDLEASWNNVSHQLEMSWNAPTGSDNILGYKIFHNGQSLGTVNQTVFSCQQDDTSGYFGVKTLYKDKKESLILYTRIGENQVSIENTSPDDLTGFSSGLTDLEVSLDRVNRQIYLHGSGSQPITDMNLRRIDIFDIRGVRLLGFQGDATVLDVSSLRQGVYVGRAIGKGGVVKVFRFIL